MIRFGTMEDIEKVNVLRKEVNDLHVIGEPEIFKGFTSELREYIKEYVGILDNKSLLVYEDDGEILGYAMIEYVVKPETAFSYSQKFVKLEELGVSSKCRGRGYGKELILKIKEEAKEKGFKQIRLDVWAFNEKAILFYLNNGFDEFRKYLRIDI